MLPVSALSSCHHRASVGSEVFAKFGVSQCSQNFALHHAFALHLAIALLLCKCCHDPFIVRSAQTCPPFTGFHSACTFVSMLTINADNCLFLCSCFSQVSVFTSGLQTQIHHSLVTFILLWSVGSMASRIPILQTCIVVVLKQRLVSFQHLRSSSL